MWQIRGDRHYLQRETITAVDLGSLWRSISTTRSAFSLVTNLESSFYTQQYSHVFTYGRINRISSFQQIPHAVSSDGWPRIPLSTGEVSCVLPVCRGALLWLSVYQAPHTQTHKTVVALIHAWLYSIELHAHTHTQDCCSIQCIHGYTVSSYTHTRLSQHPMHPWQVHMALWQNFSNSNY